ncbi:MAG: acyloxyacyl hydrolase [Alphaproteobacteria bacterium]|nr:acyloxyacyl hydrolase [Alphaproteobacteria bacterium]
MKKILCALIISSVGATAMADTNPFFNGYDNQIAFNAGAGVNSGFLIPPPSQFVPYTMFEFQYSQPTTFFRLPARQSINIVMNVGYGEKYGWHWDDFTIPMAVISEDIALFHCHDWYGFMGLGAGMQLQQNERIGSKLVFGFKLGTGYHISDQIGIEAFVQHFSNGNTAPENNSYAFYGLGITYNF